MLEGDDTGAFALFLRPHPGEFKRLMSPSQGNLPNSFKKHYNARGLAQGWGGGRGRWALLELTDALRRGVSEVVLQIRNIAKPFDNDIPLPTSFYVDLSFLVLVQPPSYVVLTEKEKTTTLTHSPKYRNLFNT